MGIALSALADNPFPRSADNAFPRSEEAREIGREAQMRPQTGFNAAAKAEVDQALAIARSTASEAKKAADDESMPRRRGSMNDETGRRLGAAEITGSLEREAASCQSSDST